MSTRSAPPGIGLLKGLGVTIKQMFTPASTQQYPHVRPELPPRTRGVIALMDENCTVCMLCSRECPDWCIYIDSHKETVPPAKEGGRARTRNNLDRFAIDFALCMYCGICIEVCPFDALFWSPEFEYAEYEIGGLLHEMERLREWADTVPPPPPLEEGATQPAEIAAALEAARKEEDKLAAAAEEQAAAAPAEAKAAPAKKAAAAEPEIEIEAGAIDQETFDALIAEGKSERVARSKAKAAYVRKAKAAAREKMAADEAAAPAPAVAEAEVHIEAGSIDQETYDALIADGKSERVARSKAKAAYVRKAKAAARDAAPAAEAAPDAPADAEPVAAPEAEVETERPASSPAPSAAADIHVDDAGAIDQETYDALIAEGKSERIARAKAKAAHVRKRKQEIRDQQDGGDQ